MGEKKAGCHQIYGERGKNILEAKVHSPEKEGER